LTEDLDLGDVDTVGGYVIRQLKRWPRVGDAVELGPFDVTVISIQQRRVQQVLITPRMVTAETQRRGEE
jgi:CBS domain containing-hemolysin-like protein